jgi:hypothetical protein
MIGPVVVGTLLVGRLAAEMPQTPARRRLVWGVAVLGSLLGLLVEAIDIDNAAADSTAVDLATAWIRERNNAAPIYFTGHWGLQFYAERAGWRPVDPDHTRLPEGGWLVVPGRELGSQRIDVPSAAVFGHHIDVESRWPLATIPWLHASNAPMRRQVGSILSLSVYRVTADCVPPTPATGGMAGP